MDQAADLVADSGAHEEATALGTQKNLYYSDLDNKMDRRNWCMNNRMTFAPWRPDHKLQTEPGA